MKSLIFLVLIMTQWAHATVNVAFFRSYDQQGNIIQLEPNGEFFHVALQIEDGRWVHIHPGRGVEIVSQIDLIGSHPVILANENWTSISIKKIEPFLGLPFDFTYRWETIDSSYCAKLVANLLAIDPMPTSFSTRFWLNGIHSYKPDVGLSPDDIFGELKKRGFLETNPTLICDKFLESPFMKLLKESK